MTAQGPVRAPGQPLTPGGTPAGWHCWHLRTDRRPRGGAALPAGVRRALAAAVPPLVLVAVGLVAWPWVIAATEVRPRVLPSPLRVLEQGSGARQQIWANTLPTLQVTRSGSGVAPIAASSATRTSHSPTL